jgi:anaerobic magnesium-protoporphyrin IX monomethyl ester cyclase
MNLLEEILLINPGSDRIDKVVSSNSVAEELSELYEKLQNKKLKKVGLKLVEPPCYSYQISRGLLCIATFLEKEGLGVKYVQMDFERNENPQYSDSEILEKHLDGIKIVGMTSYTHNFNVAKRLAHDIKKNNPNILLVFGGPHACALEDEVILEPSIDVIVRGEGEKVFREICLSQNFEKIPSISYKKDGKILKNEDMLPPLNSDEILTPAYHLMDNIPNATFVLETARGCPNRCLFCDESSFWGGIRYRNLDEVSREIKEIKSRGYNTVHICDPIFPLKKERVREFSKICKSKMNFNCNVRVETLDQEMLELLLESGIYSIFLGIESCSNKVLEFMNKRITFERYYEALKDIKKNRKNELPLICVSWMIGHPGEDRETLKESFERMSLLIQEGLVDEVWPKVFVPYPGTEVFKNSEKYGLNIKNREWNDYLRQDCLPVYELETLSSEEIYEAYENAMRMVFDAFKKTLKKGDDA